MSVYDVLKMKMEISFFFVVMGFGDGDHLRGGVHQVVHLLVSLSLHL